MEIRLGSNFHVFFGDKEGRAGCGVNRIVLGIELKFHPFSQRAATLPLHLASVQRPLGSFLFLFFPEKRQIATKLATSSASLGEFVKARIVPLTCSQQILY